MKVHASGPYIDHQMRLLFWKAAQEQHGRILNDAITKALGAAA